MDNKLRIINYLGKNIGGSFTMHGLAKVIRIPYATFHRTISGMNGLVNTQIVGRSKIVSLNVDNPIIKNYLTISSEEEKGEYLKRQPIISKMASEIETKDTIVLFGSYAKGTQRESSDIDLLILNERGNRSVSFSKYDTLFKKNINPIFMTRKEFSRMLRDKSENLGKQVLRNHIILRNPETFWEAVLDGRV